MSMLERIKQLQDSVDQGIKELPSRDDLPDLEAMDEWQYGRWQILDWVWRELHKIIEETENEE